MATVDKWVGFGSAMVGLGLVWSRLPDRVRDELSHFITMWIPMVASYFNPYEQVTISEYSEEHSRCRSELFDATEAYLNEKFVNRASKLKADIGIVDSDLPCLTMDENQEIVHDFMGARIWWNLSKELASFDCSKEDARRKETSLYRAVFHKRHRDLVLETYLSDIIREGRELNAKKRKRRLFRNNRHEGKWSHVPAEHPATFEHLAMDPAEKKKVMDDLEAFKEGKSYYSMVGKAWKRGYLLYGPPGTGKSTMISAMANFLKYDVYDLDLTSVSSNDQLQKLFLETKSKSIIVLEDIDAIEYDFTSKRKDDENQMLGCKCGVTLSGLLNFADGLWSACGGERIFVFTTNYFDRLDPALTRSGRMDMHIEMSYCRFEAFKVFAKNYLKVAEHGLFGEIEQLLDVTDISPADVAHHLMPKKRKRDADETCTSQENLRQYWDESLEGLVETLKKAKKDSEATTSTQENARASRPLRSTRVGTEAQGRGLNLVTN